MKDNHGSKVWLGHPDVATASSYTLRLSNAECHNVRTIVIEMFHMEGFSIWLCIIDVHVADHALRSPNPHCPDSLHRTIQHTLS